MKRLLGFLLLCLLFSPIFAVEKAHKGDVVLGGGWAYSAPTSGTDERMGDWTVTFEYMMTKKLSIRADYYRLSEEAEDPQTHEPYAVDPPGISLTLAPHFGNLSFPIGVAGFDTHDRKNAEFGAVGGVWLDFWTTNNLGLGIGGSYLYLQNTTLDQDSYDVRGELRLKF